MWPFLLGVYQLDSTADACRTQNEAARDRYEKLTTAWQEAEQLARKREEEAAVPDNPTLQPSFFERRNHELKMEFFRKDSSLSNDVFESVDAPGCSTLEETCRPETVVEESSRVTSPVSEPADCGMKVESREDSESLPVKAGNVDFSRKTYLFPLCLLWIALF